MTTEGVPTLFAIDVAFDPATLAEVAEARGAHYQPVPARSFQTWFADTPSLRLLRWDTLLVRTADEGWRARSRNGLDVPLGGADDVPPGARDLLAGLVRGEELRTRVRTRTLRRGGDVTDGAGDLLAALRMDQVAVMEGPSNPPPFGILSLTSSGRCSAGLGRKLRQAVVGAGGVEVHQPRVLRTALGPLGTSLRPEVSIPDLPDDPTVSAVIQRSFASSVTRFVHADPIARLGTDPEGVHQMRVGARRLRSDMRTFRAYLDPDWSEPLRSELRWLGTSLGPVRDADVMTGDLGERARRLDPEDREGAAALVERVLRDRDEARVRMLEMMSSVRYARLVDRLVEAASHQALWEGASTPVKEVASKLVPYRPLSRAVGALTSDSVFADYHKVRIRAKRCRYAAEALEPALGADAGRFARRLAALQDLLGEYCDAVVTLRWLRGAAVRAGTGEAFVAGLLAGQKLAEGESRLAELGHAWGRASQKDLRKFLR